MADAIVKFTRHGNVARVAMSRPPHNLLEGSLIEQLSKAFARAVEDGCRAVLLTSELRHFSAGADLVAADTGELQKLDLISFLREMETLPIPIIAAVNGLALGGGFELALGCDLIIAAESAQIGLVETSLGLFPIMGGISRAVARVGLARGKEFVLLGRRYSASTMAEWGMINRVVPAETLAEASMALAQELAAGPTLAYGAVRRLANVAAAYGVHAADELSSESASEIWATNDVRAGLQSFRETGSASAVFNGS